MNGDVPAPTPAAPHNMRPLIVLHRAPLVAPPALTAPSKIQLSLLPSLQPLLTPEGLDQLARECGHSLDPQAALLLGEIADDFVENVTAFAAEIARYRGASEITCRDLQLHLQLNWGLDVPLPVDDEVAAGEPPLKRAHSELDAASSQAGPSAQPPVQVQPSSQQQQAPPVQQQPQHQQQQQPPSAPQQGPMSAQQAPSAQLQTGGPTGQSSQQPQQPQQQQQPQQPQALPESSSHMQRLLLKSKMMLHAQAK